MSIRFDAAADRLVRTANVLSYQSAFTIAGWFYFVTIPATGTLFSLSVGDTNDYDYFGITAAGVLLAELRSASGSSDDYTGSTLTTGTWYHLAFVRDGTNTTGYLNGVQDLQGANHTGRPASTRFEVGGWRTTDSNRLDGRACALKAWTTNLSVAQVQQERRVMRPRTLGNLYSWTPGLPGSGQRARDYSGNGYDWTEGGTLTDEDHAPIGWGATIVALPFMSATPTLDLKAYRWRNDDGSESAASWAAAENAALGGAAGAKRIRVQIDNTNDPGAIAPQWEWRLKPSGGSFGSWRTIK